jgi:predicted kinase
MNELIHLICGSTGAGKTTYARQVSEQVGGVRFSIDDWMACLFWKDTPQPLSANWSLERVERCLTQIWSTARSVAQRGVPCVLDVGFAEAASRMRFIRLAQEAALPVRLHFLDVPPEERWRRVQARNGDSANCDRLPFEITREMFDFVETLWEPPTEQELSGTLPMTVRR